MNCLDKYSDSELLELLNSNVELELRNRGYDFGWYKTVQYAGDIYILVNPAFPNLVKIGYADNVAKRLKTLNSNSGLPDPYHVYATYKVKKRLEDLKLHDLIDSLDSDLRHSKNREFYEMTPEKAYKILSAIAQINGDEDLLVLNPLKDDFFQPKTNNHFIAGDDETHIPDGKYFFSRRKKSDNNKNICGTAIVKDGNWTILKGAVFAINEDAGVTQLAKQMRKNARLDNDGNLLENLKLGKCSPSNAGCVLMNQSINGWTDWKTENGVSIDVFRKKEDTYD